MSDSELLDVFDGQGRRVGVKPRFRVHRDGDWHVLVFVLAARVGPDGRPRMLLQLRSGAGDRYHGQADVLAAGHAAAGESARDAAVRELREEAGLEVPEADLEDLGTRLLENPTGVCRRAIQRFFLCRRAILIADPAFSDEVGGFLEVDLDDLDELILGARSRIPASARTPDSDGAPADLHRDRFSAYSPEVLANFRWCLAQVRTRLVPGRAGA